MTIEPFPITTLGNPAAAVVEKSARQNNVSIVGLQREIEAAKLLTAQIAALSGDDPDFIRDTIEGETNLHEIMSALVADEAQDKAQIEGIDILLNKLEDRKKRFKARIEMRRSLLGLGMEVAGLPKLETPAGTISLAKVPPSVITQDESLIPSEFWAAQPPKLDRKALAEALKGGKQIPGATLSNGGQTVKIR